MNSCSQPALERETLAQARRMLVKVGTRLVTEPGGGLNMVFLDRLARQIARLNDRDVQVIVVTSGSVHLGRKVLRNPRTKETLTYRQAAAAVGQPELMRNYSAALSAHGLVAAQMLLTMDDMVNRQRYINARNALELLLRNRIVPVINENDSVSLEGVTFVENDKLASMVATKMRVDVLMLLSDQPGLCTADPRLDPQATLISRVCPGEALSASVTDAGGSESRGGMRAKLAAARQAADCGIPVVMADGTEENVLLRVCAGEQLGTYFVPRAPVGGKKLWIATAAEPAGQVFIDAGACVALQHENGASLLPPGVTGTAGDYEAGDLVSVIDPQGREVARGLVNYSAAEVGLIAGVHTSRLADILGHVGHDEIIHRDNLVLTCE